LTKNTDPLHSADSSTKTSKPPGKDGCTAVLSKLTRHLPAVLRFARHGLHRRAEPGDVALRRMAVTAARALHRAGLGGDPGGNGWVGRWCLGWVYFTFIFLITKMKYNIVG